MQDTGFMNLSRSSRSRIVVRVLAAFLILSVLAAGGFYLLLVQPGKGGVLARSATPDGTELLVTQEWNGWDIGGEPYTVSFYSKKPGGPWLWQYLDHEARRWPDCRLQHDPGSRSVQVFSGGQLKETIDLDWPHQHERTPPYLVRGS